MREGGGRAGARGIGRGVSARAREGRRPTPIVSRGFRATRACDRVPRGGRTISATALDARRRERAGRTARREARRGARRPNAVRRAAETCAVERASDMESGAGGQKPSRPGGRPCWTAHAEKTGRAPRATPRGPFYFPRARFRCSRLRLVRRPDSFGAHFPRGARARLRGLAPARAPTPVSARPSSCAAATPRAATTTATATRAAAAGTRGARGGCAGSSRRSRTSARATAPTARTTAPRANPARATPARARGCDEVRDEDAPRQEVLPRVLPLRRDRGPPSRPKKGESARNPPIIHRPPRR